MLGKKARKALEMCARKSGVELGILEKDDNGAPVPFDGHFWSLTHKPAYVGAVIGPEAMGIDIEAIRDVSDGLIRKTAREEEWRLAASDPASVFFRYWTAKEAVLKRVPVFPGCPDAGSSRFAVTIIYALDTKAPPIWWNIFSLTGMWHPWLKTDSGLIGR